MAIDYCCLWSSTILEELYVGRISTNFEDVGGAQDGFRAVTLHILLHSTLLDRISGKKVPHTL